MNCANWRMCLQGVPEDGLGIRLLNMRFHGPRHFPMGSGPLALFANAAARPSAGGATSQVSILPYFHKIPRCCEFDRPKDLDLLVSWRWLGFYLEG